VDPGESRIVGTFRRREQSPSKFPRNLLAHVPKTHSDIVAAVFRTIFAQPDAGTVAATWQEVRDQFAARFPKIGPLMDAAKTEVLAFTAFPRPHWPKIWSTNHSSASTRRSSGEPASSAYFRTRQRSSGSSEPSSPTCTTSGNQATAATSSRGRWPSLNPAAILRPSP
jgi:hypothetical protein